jgi:hypothetical protein
MKYIGIGILIVLLASGFTPLLKKEKPHLNGNPEEKSFIIMPNPANNYLDVKINYNSPDTGKRSVASFVKVFNSQGVMVYSATKEAKQFSIFTGGLPEGEYKITCKVDTSMFKQNFLVKH